MEKSAELLERVAASKPIARKLEAIQAAQWPVRFSHVIQPAQPFLAAVIANARHGVRIDKRQAADSTIWVLSPSVHSQEVFYESLLNWQPDALFLPEAELAGIENVLPDPEITAERLALFLQIERDTGPSIIVATRAGLDQAAPKRGSLESAVVQLRRGATAKMEELLERLVASGYERVSQVTTRGQFAVRGGIVDLYSWQAPLPFRLEFFGDEIESLREFDIDSQTSVRDLRSIDILLGNQGAAVSSPLAKNGGLVRDYIREHDLIIDIEPDGISNAHVQISEGWIETGPEDFSGAFQDCEIGEFGAGDLVLAEAKRAQFIDRLKEWRANNSQDHHLFSDRRRDRAVPRDYGRARWKELISSRARSRADFVFRQPIWSFFRLPNCSDDSRSIRGGFCGFGAQSVIALKSISANSLKAIWSSISSTASEDSSD